MYKLVILKKELKYSWEDITVIIPIIHNKFEVLKASLDIILACNPTKLILVTTAGRLLGLLTLTLISGSYAVALQPRSCHAAT